jgi:hypothetical protein
MLYKPGDAAPDSGLYEAIHHSHRAPHTISVTAGAHFPDCNICDGDVRFRFVRAAAPIEFDEDFR